MRLLSLLVYRRYISACLSFWDVVKHEEQISQSSECLNCYISSFYRFYSFL